MMKNLFFDKLHKYKKIKIYQLRSKGKIIGEKLKSIGLGKKKFGLHSFRSGEASTVANAGIPKRVFKKHGRQRFESAKDGYVKESIITQLSVFENLGI